MKIFLKYIRKNMIEKKGRLLLLILSIMLSTALLTASAGITELVKNIYTKPMTEALEGKEINITSEAGSFFDTADLNVDGIKNLREELAVTGILSEDRTISYARISGREYAAYQDFTVLEGTSKELTGSECMVSSRTMKERGLRLGDQLKTTIQNEEVTLTVAAVSANEGIFYMDGKSEFTVIVPYQFLNKQLDAGGRYNVVYAKSTESSISNGIKTFDKVNKDYTAKELYNQDALDNQIASIGTILYVMLAAVILVSTMIIYGVFKLIVTERLSVIGTFFSQGATRGKVRNILLLESFFYGVIGAVLGSSLGILILYIAGRALSPLAEFGIYEQFQVSPFYVLLGIVFGCGLSILSAWMPIHSIRKLPVKDVILDDIKVSANIGWKKFIVGCVLLGAATASVFFKGDWTITYSPIFMASAIIGTIMVYPQIVNQLSKGISHFMKGKNNTAFFALHNVRTSKVLLSNITLILFALITSIMVTSMSNMLVSMVEDAYKKMYSDIEVKNILENSGSKTTTDTILEELKEIKGIEQDSLNTIYNATGTIGDVGFPVEGMQLDKYDEYNGYLNFDAPKNRAVYNRMESYGKNGIILTKGLIRKLDCEVEDSIKLKIDGIEREMKVLGVIDGKAYNMGMMLFMDQEYLKEEFGIKEASAITARTSESPDKVKEKVEDKIHKYGSTCTTKAQNEKENYENNQMMGKGMSIFSYMTIFIAGLGIINNISIGFLQRKKEMAVFSSVGMNKQKRGALLAAESLLCVIWASFIAGAVSFLNLKLMEKIFEFVGFSMPLEMDFILIGSLALGAAAVVVLSSLPVIFRSRKLSIIKELRFE